MSTMVFANTQPFPFPLFHSTMTYTYLAHAFHDQRDERSDGRAQGAQVAAGFVVLIHHTFVGQMLNTQAFVHLRITTPRAD
jgi:hypothetical protein